jgi:hypothetical protein
VVRNKAGNLLAASAAIVVVSAAAANYDYQYDNPKTSAVSSKASIHLISTS